MSCHSRRVDLTHVGVRRPQKHVLTVVGPPANVLRHAGETRVSITLERIDQSVVIRIRDNGRGFSEEAVSKKDTSGLYGMRERAELCGGRLEIESAPGKGTTVRACLPMDIDSMEAKS